MSGTVWLMALFIFMLRVVDVSMGTVRTLSVVQGRIRVSVMLGFVEILIWVTAIAQVIRHLDESPLLPVAYAAGFAAGNGLGILIERRLGWGTVIVRFMSTTASEAIVRYFHGERQWAAAFKGQGIAGEETIVFGTCSRRALQRLLDFAVAQDPHVLYSVEPVMETRQALRTDSIPPIAGSTGWRSRLLRK